MSAGEVKRPYGLLLKLVTRNFFFLIICDIFNKQMWSHGVSHKSFARLIYCTKCCRGVFLVEGVDAWRKRVRRSGCKSSWRHSRVSRDWPLIPARLVFLCGTRGPRPALERMLSPGRSCRVSALFLASCVPKHLFTGLGCCSYPSRCPSKRPALLYWFVSCPDSPSCFS